MTQPLCGEYSENSDSPSLEGLHEQFMGGKEEPGWLLAPCPPESQRASPGKDGETDAVTKPQGKDKP